MRPVPATKKLRPKRIDDYGVVHYVHHGVDDESIDCGVMTTYNFDQDSSLVWGASSVTCLDCLSLEKAYCSTSSCYRSTPAVFRYCTWCE